MPKVTLISYTGHGNPDPLYAAKLLAFTKNTRLSMVPDGLEKFMSMQESALMEELAYMAGTIPSSWEFADLIFLLTDVSRSTAQQITRTRNASFAMQSMRVTDMRDVSWDVPKAGTQELRDLFNHQMELNVSAYEHLVDFGMSKEDARDILPLGVHCNIVAKYNLRSWVDLVTKRQSLRVQGPYRDIVSQMVYAVLAVWPWAEVFLENPHDKALHMLEDLVEKLSGGGVPQGDAAIISKAIDLIKKPE